MNNFILSTDKCCDEYANDLNNRNIEYIPIAFICGEEVTYDRFSTEEEYKEFYRQLLSGKKFTTSGLNYTEVEEYFLELLKKYNSDIVHICLSSGLSGTYNTVSLVAEELNKTSKNKIYVVDSLSATVGQALVLAKAEVLRNQGVLAKDAYALLNDFTKNVSASFFVPDLNALKAGGRISGIVAAVAKLIQMKPYLEIDGKGELKVVQKIIGAGNKKAISVMVQRFINTFDDSENLPIYIVKTTDNEAAMDLLHELQKHTDREIFIKSMGPVISAHTGAGTLGLVFKQKDVK